MATVIAGAGDSPPHIRAAVAYFLQRTVGNAAFRRLVAPQRGPSRLHVQRQPTTKTREELDAAYQAAVAAGNWAEAAQHLNGFNDADIATRVGSLSHDQLIWLYTAALGSLSGVSQNRILSPIVTRDLDAAYQACVRTANWSSAATPLNGFNDAVTVTSSDQGFVSDLTPGDFIVLENGRNCSSSRTARIWASEAETLDSKSAGAWFR